MVLVGPYVDLHENAGRRTQDAGGLWRGPWMGSSLVCETLVRGNHSTASLVDERRAALHIGQGYTSTGRASTFSTQTTHGTED